MLRKKLKPYRFGLNKSNNEGDNTKLHFLSTCNRYER